MLNAADTSDLLTEDDFKYVYLCTNENVRDLHNLLHFELQGGDGFMKLLFVIFTSRVVIHLIKSSEIQLP